MAPGLRKIEKELVRQDHWDPHSGSRTLVGRVNIFDGDVNVVEILIMT